MERWHTSLQQCKQCSLNTSQSRSIQSCTCMTIQRLNHLENLNLQSKWNELQQGSTTQPCTLRILCLKCSCKPLSRNFLLNKQLYIQHKKARQGSMNWQGTLGTPCWWCWCNPLIDTSLQCTRLCKRLFEFLQDKKTLVCTLCIVYSMCSNKEQFGNFLLSKLHCNQLLKSHQDNLSWQDTWDTPCSSCWCNPPIDTFQ